MTTATIHPTTEPQGITIEGERFEPTTDDVCKFLSDYAVVLFGSGATCIRIEKNVRRIADSLGMVSHFSILPRHVHITVTTADGDDSVTRVAAIREMPISFECITVLSTLSWDMADHIVDFTEATSRLQQVRDLKVMNRWTLLILVSLANASFCRLFGGTPMAMAVVFVATMAGFFIKQRLASKHVDFRLVAMVSAFVSAVFAAGDYLFGLSATPEVAIGTSVLYLVPGIPFINSFCDMVDRHYLCAFGRLMNAVVICFSLSLGLCLAMLLMGVGMF